MTTTIEGNQFSQLLQELRSIGRTLEKIAELNEQGEKREQSLLAERLPGDWEARAKENWSAVKSEKSQQAWPADAELARIQAQAKDDAAQTFDSEPATNEQVDEVLTPDANAPVSKPASKLVNPSTGKPKS